MKCEHDNCLTCPYPDCISAIGPAHKTKKKPGRKRIDPEEKKLHAKIYQQKYYQEHKEQHKLSTQKYYKNHVEEIREKQRKYRERNGLVTGKRITSFWMNNGITSIRVKTEQYDQYLKEGWKRGRILHPYKK